MNLALHTRIFVCISLLATLVLGLGFVQRANASMSVTHDLTVEFGKPYRVLAYHQIGYNPQYWIVSQGYGLVRMYEDPPGEWQLEYYGIGPVYDAAGPVVDDLDPDNNGLIYCTYLDSSSNDTGIYVFDCKMPNPGLVGTIDVDVTGYLHEPTLTGLVIGPNVLPPDERSLYVCAWTYPDLGDPYYPGNDKPNSGRLVRVGMTSGANLGEVVVRARPETVFLTNASTLLVSSLQSWWAEPINPPNFEKSRTELVRIEPFQNTGQYLISNYGGLYMNDFVDWDGFHVAQLTPNLRGDWEDPTFEDAIWVLDPSNNSLWNHINIKDGLGTVTGVKHGCISQAHPGYVYLSLLESHTYWDWVHSLIITDFGGAFLGSIDTDQFFYPEFIHELEDGRLVVTGGKSRRVIVVGGVPYNLPPVCSFTATPNPYVGPAPAFIEFDASESYDPDGGIATYEWDFDDGTTGMGMIIQHAYYETGQYNVSLTVTDFEGEPTTCYEIVDVTIQ